MAQGRFTQIISMIKWIRTSRLSIKKSLPLDADNFCARTGCDPPDRRRRRLPHRQPCQKAELPGHQSHRHGPRASCGGRVPLVQLRVVVRARHALDSTVISLPGGGWFLLSLKGFGFLTSTQAVNSRKVCSSTQAIEESMLGSGGEGAGSSFKEGSYLRP